MNTCHNCGLPSDCSSSEGYTLTIEHRAENKFRRNSRRTVWCHSEECAIQTLAIAKYGLPTYRWPISLSQFRATAPLDSSNVRKPTSEVTDSTKSESALFDKGDLEAGNPVYERPERKGGRPRKWASDAERMRARRAAMQERRMQG
jgi:hypothetical protein